MGCNLVVNVDAEEIILFVPRVDPLYEIWMTVLSAEQFSAKYELKTQFNDELEAFIKDFNPSTVYLNAGVNSDSQLSPALPDEKYYKGFNANREDLNLILSEARVFKSEAEIDILRWATIAACNSHIEVLQRTEPGMLEYHVENIFVHHGRMRYLSHRVGPYSSICGCGPGAATLHYPDNDKLLKDGLFMLTDQGHRLHGYCSDITVSWPVNGKFTKKQADIYNIVLKANRDVMAAVKPGVNWLDMHKLAERTTIQGLLDLGIVKGDLEKLLDSRLGFIFQPHGLGHFYGLETHDVGGYLKGTPERSSQLGLKNLRTARTLEAGMCVTIEPGLYFRNSLLHDANDLGIDLSCLNLDLIKEYMKEIEGTRIEDCCVVTANGVENLSAMLPRTVEEIEACMAKTV